MLTGGISPLLETRYEGEVKPVNTQAGFTGGFSWRVASSG